MPIIMPERVASAMRPKISTFSENNLSILLRRLRCMLSKCELIVAEPKDVTDGFEWEKRLLEVVVATTACDDGLFRVRLLDSELFSLLLSSSSPYSITTSLSTSPSWKRI